MASYYNRVVLMGNVTRDIEVRYTTSQMAVCDLGMAVNDRRKNGQGEWYEETTFVDITLFGRTAEVAGEYLSKGSPVFIEGRLKLDQWEQDGQKRSKLKVVGERLQLIGSKPGGGSGGNSSGQQGGAQQEGGGQQDGGQHSEYSQPVTASAPTSSAPPQDDIPF